MPPSISLQVAEAPCSAPGVTRSTRRAAMRANGVVQTPGPQPALPPMSPPHAPCSPSAGAVAWPPTSLPTPVRSYRTLSPLTCALAGHRRVCSLLPSCVTQALPPGGPHLRFRGATFHLAVGEESGSSSGGWPQRRLVTRRSLYYTTCSKRSAQYGAQTRDPERDLLRRQQAKREP
jgi:hypothetical protein